MTRRQKKQEGSGRCCPASHRMGYPGGGTRQGLRRGQLMELLSKTSISPSEAAVTVQHITMLRFRSDFPPRACLFCRELIWYWRRSARLALCNAKEKGFPPFFPFFSSPPPFFLFFLPFLFLRFPTLATHHQDVIPAPVLLQDLLPHHQGHKHLGILAGLSHQENLGGQMGERHGGS